MPKYVLQFNEIVICDWFKIMNLPNCSTVQVLCQIVDDLFTVSTNINHCGIWLEIGFKNLILDVNVVFLFSTVFNEHHEVTQRFTHCL